MRQGLGRSLEYGSHGFRFIGCHFAAQNLAADGKRIGLDFLVQGYLAWSLGFGHGSLLVPGLNGSFTCA